jgi:hypothetical protein
MKPQYQHELMTSFMLFFDHHLLNKGEAYSNKTGKLYYFDDSRLPDSYTVFASPYKQWVNDSSVVGDTNPIIPTGISGDSTSGRNDGFVFDFENGRIIHTGEGKIKAVVFAENSYQLDGILSIFADTRHKIFQRIPFTGHPSTEYGDIKEGSYNFSDLSERFSTPSPYTIEDVTVSKFSDKGQQALPGNVKVGFIDFEVTATRFPRAPQPVSPSLPKNVTSADIFNRFVQERNNLDSINRDNITISGHIPNGVNGLLGPGSDSEGNFDMRYTSINLSDSLDLIKIGTTGIAFAQNERFKLTALGSTVRRATPFVRGSFTVTTGSNFVSGNLTLDPVTNSVASHSFKLQVTDSTSVNNYIDTTITGVKIESQIRVTGEGDNEFIFNNGSAIIDVHDFTQTIKLDNFDDD